MLLTTPNLCSIVPNRSSQNGSTLLFSLNYIQIPCYSKCVSQTGSISGPTLDLLNRIYILTRTSGDSYTENFESHYGNSLIQGPFPPALQFLNYNLAYKESDPFSFEHIKIYQNEVRNNL